MDANISIIGAGVVGLAMAAELSKKYKNIFILEKYKKFGQETSSRNSEVIHSGVYYPHNSLKSKMCIKGKELLYAYCDSKSINYKKCGKIIIAENSEEEFQLKAILNNAKKNGVRDCKLINKKEIEGIEPNINAISGIHFSSTGIIDSHGLMKQLSIDAINNGVEIVYDSKLTNIKKIDGGYEVVVKDNQDSYHFTSEIVINIAGLYSDVIAELVGISDETYKLYYWKGEYFSIGNGKNKLINGLVYPVPNKNNTGLGVHTTVDLSGGVKLGPNAIFLPKKNIDYTVESSHQIDFYNSVKSFMPFLKYDDLRPDQAGIRPKLQKPGDKVRDFIIKNEVSSGFKNFINLIGIESPGLTSCLAIAKYVDSLIM